MIAKIASAGTKTGGGEIARRAVRVRSGQTGCRWGACGNRSAIEVTIRAALIAVSLYSKICSDGRPTSMSCTVGPCWSLIAPNSVGSPTA